MKRALNFLHSSSQDLMERGMRFLNCVATPFYKVRTNYLHFTGLGLRVCPWSRCGRLVRGTGWSLFMLLEVFFNLILVYIKGLLIQIRSKGGLYYF